MYTKTERDEIRQGYRSWKPRTCPYFLAPHGGWKFSPAEEYFWHTIRCGGLPFYPEYPVLNYFIDFADPEKKIGIEIDGKQWHKDEMKDKVRQHKIEKEGWEIHRINAKWCVCDAIFERDNYLFDPDYRKIHNRFSTSEEYYIIDTLYKIYKGHGIHDSNSEIMSAFTNGEY